MACDSLYCAYLKAYYPYEFYTTALKLYTEKGKKDKIALLIDEMRHYCGITMQTGIFGQDNRDWTYDKEAKTISQNLSAIKHISKSVTADMYKASLKTYSTFTDLLWELMQNSSIDSRQIEILIKLGYFRQFGDEKKLLTLSDEFRNGKYRLSKTVKSYAARLEALRKMEAEMKVKPAAASERAAWEFEYTGMCFACDPYEKGIYLVSDVDDKYSIKLRLYNISKGRYTEWLRMKKDVYAQYKPKAGELVKIKAENCKTLPKFVWNNDKTQGSSGEKETWISAFTRVPM